MHLFQITWLLLRIMENNLLPSGKISRETSNASVMSHPLGYISSAEEVGVSKPEFCHVDGFQDGKPFEQLPFYTVRPAWRATVLLEPSAFNGATHFVHLHTNIDQFFCFCFFPFE